MSLRRYFAILILLLSNSVWAVEDLIRLNWLSESDDLVQLISHPHALNRIYKTQNFQLIWYQPKASQELESALSVLSYAGLSEAFSYRLYQLSRLRKAGDWYKYDVLATDTLIEYALYARLVERYGFDWLYGGSIVLPDIPASRYTTSEIIASAEAETLSEYVRSLTATPDQMKYVQQAMVRLRSAANTSVRRYVQIGVAKQGDVIAHKKVLLARLEAVGLNTEGVNAEGILFDAELAKLVKRFQRLHGLTPDGVIGEETLNWINFPFDQRLRTLALNTERSRLMPKERDNLIIVNLPSFHLNYWYKGTTKFSSRVIVGKEERKTPLLKVKLDTLIVNPSWNVPPKLVKEDIIPKVKRDIAYLDRMNIKVVKRWWSTEEVDPHTIDWQQLDAENFSYNMTQAPGKSNALGRFKFNTPNPRAIFLHDTPSKHLFNRADRAHSSGCIRVQHAERLAKTLLLTQEIEMSDSIIETEEENKKFPLREPIPVHILYQTAWIDHGLVHYRKDIYNYDQDKSIFSLSKN